MSGRSDISTESVSAKPTDGQLARMAVCDRQAFGVLFDRYWDQVFRYCSFRVGDWHEAEDIASQVFVRAFDGLDRFEGAGNPDGFRAWLFGIARHVVADAHRFRARHPATALDAAGQVPSQVPALDEQIVASEQQQLLARLLTQLKNDQRDLMELRLAGLSAGEIGQVLGKSPEAVRVAQFRAIKALKDAVAVECGDGGCDSHG